MVINIFKRGKKNAEEEYVEVIPVHKAEEVKIYIKVFKIKDSSDVKAVVDTLREGNTIVFVDLRRLNESKDLLEIKKVISRIKSVVEAINGDIVAVEKDWIIATPSFARVWRKPSQEGQTTEQTNE